MTVQKPRKPVEWIGGFVKAPFYVQDDAEPFRPDVLVWIDSKGRVLGVATPESGELDETAGRSLRETMQNPAIGQPHRPSRVRVTSPDLADSLQRGVRGIDIVCAPTPELDELAAAWHATAETNEKEAQANYLKDQLSPDVVGRFFDAMARLYHAKTWHDAPALAEPMAVTIETLGVREAVVTITGVDAEANGLGFVWFASLDDFNAFCDASDAEAAGRRHRYPPHGMVGFERRRATPPYELRAIAEHGWRVAADDAYPWLLMTGPNGDVRPSTIADSTVAEAIALALSELAVEGELVRAAWGGRASIARTLRVPTHTGEVEVAVRIPFEDEPLRILSPRDLLGALSALSAGPEQSDSDERYALEDELLCRFAESPDCGESDDVEPCSLVLEFLADIGATLPTLTPTELEQVIFEIIPEKVSIDAHEAGPIIERNLAFFTFLKREAGLAQADALIEVLSGDAVADLGSALSDPAMFGQAKLFAMAGREAGFDMSTKAGADAWMRVVSQRPTPARGAAPAAGSSRRPVKQTAPKAKKAERQAASKARKKNRRR